MQKYTYEMLLEASKTSSNFSEVGRKLGVKNPSYCSRYLKARMQKLNISIDHFNSPSGVASNKSYTRDEAIAAVKNCNSAYASLIELGLCARGNAIREFKKALCKWNIDTSHFYKTTKGSHSKRKKKSAAVLVERPPNGYKEDVRRLRRALLESGVKECCVGCGLTIEWSGLQGLQHIRLQIDHVNGVCTDNRKENLRFLCPNCHSQTATWGSKNNREFRPNELD